MNWRAQGFRAWLLQRLTAVYMALFFVWFFTYLSVSPPANYEAWQAMAGSVLGVMAFSLFFFALLLHAWVGVRDIVIDYIHPFVIRFTVLTLVGVGLIAMALWLLRIIFSLNG